MFDIFFSYLLDTFKIASCELVPFQDKDDKGKVIGLTIFIPWSLVHQHSIKVSDVQSKLPKGWNATESKRNKDMQAALEGGISSPVYSIAINEQTDAKDAVAEYLASKAK